MLIFLYTINFIIFIYFQPALPLTIGLLIGAISYSKGGCFIFNVKQLYWYCYADYPFNQYNKININNLHKTRNAITFSLRRHIHRRHISPVSVFKSYVHNFVCFHL